MQICLDCGHVFGEEEASEQLEHYGPGMVERWMACPECGSTELAGAVICKRCGEYAAHNELSYVKATEEEIAKGLADEEDEICVCSECQHTALQRKEVRDMEGETLICLSCGSTFPKPVSYRGFAMCPQCHSLLNEVAADCPECGCTVPASQLCLVVREACDDIWVCPDCCDKFAEEDY